MILAAVAFVLAATVLLGIGVVVDAGAVFIWASIGACLLAFAVLGIRASVRRRGRDTDAAEAAPAPEGASQPLARRRRVRPAGDAVPAGFVAMEPDDDDEPTVTILPGDGAAEATSAASGAARGPDEEATPPHAGFLDEVGDEPTVTIFLGGRARQAAASAEEPTPDGVPVADEVDAADGADEPDDTVVATDPGPPAPAPAAAARVTAARRVVRPRDESTRTVVQLVVTPDGTIGRRVVRRSSANTPRTVRRVVRRAADADAGED